MSTQLEQVAAIAYLLGDGEDGLQKTAGIFGTISRTLRRPLVGPWRQLGKELSEATQHKLMRKAQEHALAAADPRKIAPSRWFHQWRASSARGNLAKEYAQYANLLQGEARGLSNRIKSIEKALNTPGLAADARKQLEQQMLFYKTRSKRIQDIITTQAGQSDVMRMPQAVPQPYAGGQSGQAGTQAGTQAGQAGTQAGQAGAQGTGQTPQTPPPVNMPEFFSKYDPGTWTRQFGEKFFADPAKMTAIGLGGLYGTSQIGVPMVKNIFGVEEK